MIKEKIINLYNSILNIKKKYLYLFGIIVVIISSVFLLQFNNSTYNLVEVKKGSLVEEVSATGNVEFPTKIDLRFKNSGRLVLVNVKDGQNVSKGQLLAKQDTSYLDAQVLEMKAGIELQKAKLDQLIGGYSNEEITLSEIALENVKKDYINIKTQQETLVSNAYKNLLNSTPEALPSGGQSDYTAPTISGNIKFPSTSSTNVTEWTIDIPNKKASNYITNNNAYEAALKTQASALSSAQSLIDQKTAELALKKAPARNYDISVYEAQVDQAESLLQKIEAQRNELMIFAPSSGFVTKINGDVGETVSPDMTIVSFIPEGSLQLKLNIIEDKIVDIKIGQEAKITFDAIPNEKFIAKVVSIDLVETISGGSVYYQTTIICEKPDERIKSGMTANVLITTDISEDVLYIPTVAIQNKDGKKIVQVLENKKIVIKEVDPGIKNSIGMTEIKSGLSEGEQIVLSNISVPKK
ncbi:MAG: Efflux transporter, RND family, MFP subunit [Candidatus Nomurabacteria bacterium GW2011_GWF1_31_48]|uniref:Efflux transporter, RND family, MFP subunit n=1 Tax=Candidatus Nomurabacteria bacterium GW2011_GWF1_31_48 TaxID=1618767 RepID=A0A0F9YDV5_9BACT|nr:MAG: Efflux transporter, RND family, MFP subunit [Candidatus Nomurabacteria bacterium GW2011_GWF1_31_48]